MNQSKIKIIAISDTHGKHRLLKFNNSGDIIIHAGDVSKTGKKSEIEDFLDWFSNLNFKYKIFISGNHDFFFESEALCVIESLLPEGVIYLNDSKIELFGIKIWGSPITPRFNNWAFNRGRGAEIKQHWDIIPKDVDILITHGPPFGILDETVYGKRTGCEELLLKVYQIKPSFHIFGHIHEEYGCLARNGTTYINASVLDDWYDLKNKPIEFEFILKK